MDANFKTMRGLISEAVVCGPENVCRLNNRTVVQRHTSEGVRYFVYRLR